MPACGMSRIWELIGARGRPGQRMRGVGERQNGLGGFAEPIHASGDLIWVLRQHKRQLGARVLHDPPGREEQILDKAMIAIGVGLVVHGPHHAAAPGEVDRELCRGPVPAVSTR